MSYSHEYYISHKEKYLEATKKYIAKKRAENDEKWLAERNEYQKEYYAKNPEQKEKKNEYDKEWRKNHPNYYKDYKKKKLEEKEENNENKCSL